MSRPAEAWHHGATTHPTSSPDDKFPERLARILGPAGEDLGVMTVAEARALADASGLDLAVLDDDPGIELVVVRIGEYGLMIYQRDEGRRAVLRDARRAVREVVDAERREARRARPAPKPWERKRADRDKR